MRAVVTPLRAPTGATAIAAATAVDYVSGTRQPALAPPTGSGDVVGYFADQTPEGPGRWLGAGSQGFGLRGTVDRASLEALLRGDDPRSGAALLTTRGSNLRARAGHTASAPVNWVAEHYTLQDAAALVGVSTATCVGSRAGRGRYWAGPAATRRRWPRSRPTGGHSSSPIKATTVGGVSPATSCCGSSQPAGGRRSRWAST